MTAARKPASITYGLDESPPSLATVLNGLQHVGVIAINLVYPLLVFRVVGAPIELVASLLSTGMIVLALATFLQARRLGPVLHDAIRQIGFASLVTSGEGGLEASHLPMLVSPEPQPRLGRCMGMSRAAIPNGSASSHAVRRLSFFLGPNAYVTPSWYATKQQTGKVAPTWDYLAIHAYGEISFFDDRAQLRDHVGELTEAHESSRASPWAVADAPTDYMDKMLGAIVGFKIAITRLEGKWKMSQNRSPQDIAGVQIGLTSEDGAPQKAVADIMTKLVRP